MRNKKRRGEQKGKTGAGVKRGENVRLLTSAESNRTDSMRLSERKKLTHRFR